jgi:hypothetical protein
LASRHLLDAVLLLGGHREDLNLRGESAGEGIDQRPDLGRIQRGVSGA